MAAAQAAAEHDRQDGDEADADGPGAARSHDDIVAADRHFDKLLVNCGGGGTLFPCGALCIRTGNPPFPRW
ncbi:hypothetical protein GCM10023161_13880 [Mycobacterium paraffinicum]|uniref:Uncharacterized protein n=1 Tax=Mycobacterium paraffinicum TaxID=53378 RepID=A0ABP8RF10_9MYCO